MDDPTLIRSAAEGDREAFRRLFEMHRDRVYRIARHVLGSPEESRDVVQRVFLRLWEKLPTYRSEFPFETWLHRITVNAAIDSFRRRRARGEEVPYEEEGPASGTARALRGGPTPEREALRAEVERIFDRLAGRLPLRQRLAWSLREIEGLPTEEVARILRTRPSTVRNQVREARKTLQRAVRSEYPEYLPRDERDGDGRRLAPSDERNGE